MSDDAEQLIAAFEDGTIDPAAFGHAMHLRMAWLFLQRLPLLDALARYGAALRGLAARHGAPEKYHETVTWALLFLIHGRLEDGGREQSWETFLAGNRDLLEWKAVLATHYTAETLASEKARRTFVFPDRHAGVR